MSKVDEVDSSLSEIPEHHRPRRLADWINPTGARKAHSLIDKVFKRKNLQIARERVKANQGAGGESIEAFGKQLDERLGQLHEQLRTDCYRPQPVRQRPIPKTDKPNEQRVLGIPTIYDRVCQQALLNRLEPIFEPVLDDANFGYRRGRSTKDALRKVWKEIEAGGEWIVDADLKDFFGSIEHEKLLTSLAIAAGRVHDPIPEVGKYLRAVVLGHVRYYGVPMNGPAIGAFRGAVGLLWWRVLRRRSQGNHLPWRRMPPLLDTWLPPARICHPYPLVRLGVITQGGSRMR